MTDTVSNPVSGVPAEVAAFLEASNANDLVALLATLDPDVSVTDKGKTHSAGGAGPV
jgi:ketosteroid isomerase-like protein